MPGPTGKIIDSARNFSSDKEIKDYYDEMGYVSLKDCMPLSLIKNLQEELNEFFASCAPEMGANFDEVCINMNYRNKETLYDFYKTGSNLTAFKNLSHALSEVIKKINGKKNSPVVEINIAYLIGLPRDNRLIYDFHQEASFNTNDVRRFENIVNVHYPIYRKSSLANGTMSVLVSSHKLGTLEGNAWRPSSDGLTSMVPKNIDEIVKTHKEVHIELDVGDCVFFHADLIHRSNFNNTDLCRAIGTSRLFQPFREAFMASRGSNHA